MIRGMLRKSILLGALAVATLLGAAADSKACHRRAACTTTVTCVQPYYCPPCWTYCCVYYYNYHTCRYEVWGCYYDAATACRVVNWLRCHGYCAYYCCYYSGYAAH